MTDTSQKGSNNRCERYHCLWGHHRLLCVHRSGAVVTKDVPDYSLIIGNPSKQTGWVCQCGETLNDKLVCEVGGFQLNQEIRGA